MTQPDAGQASAVLAAQLAAIDRWLELGRADQRALVPAQHASRDHHLELRRRASALTREATALREHCSHGEHQPRSPRVVLVHRNAWLTGKLQAGLTERGVHVAAVARDGAVGCGIAIAEAPDLVFLETTLPSLPGTEVIRRVRHCSPATLLTAQVPHQEQVGTILDAGAAAVWTRQVPPADLVQAVCALLAQPPAPPGSPAPVTAAVPTDGQLS